MNNAVLIIGESGTGKSTSIRTLPPKETFIINVIGKPLPFRGSSDLYQKLSADGLTGNYYCSDKGIDIQRAIQLVNLKRPEIKYLVIDDFGFSLMNAFMSKALEKGYDKFSLLAKDFRDTLEHANKLRDDLFCFVMMHVEADLNGKTKPRTIGKMIDQYVYVESRFTWVLHTIISDEQYKFITNNDGVHMAKSSMGCFETKLIDNDLMLVVDSINKYLNLDKMETAQ